MQRYITDLGLYQIRAKEHQVVDRRDADHTSVLQTFFLKYLEYASLILCNQKKLNRRKIVRFKISSFLSAQYFLETAAK